MSDFVPAQQITDAKQALDRLRANMRLTIRGKDDVIEQVIVCLVAGGRRQSASSPASCRDRS
ncbi:MAG: hypothetical protein L0Y57_08900 [Beijerinckiaceae bacterium]|nr:hypothetical protein [Beijerinckiaceae bacterium]